MRKVERKARLKAMKAAQKAAKRMAREAAALAPAVQAAPEAAPIAAAVVETATEALPETADSPRLVEAVALAETTTGTVPNFGNSPDSAAGDSPRDQVAAARELHKGSDLIGEAESAAMLSRAARLLDDVIAASKAALAAVTPARLREALEMANSQAAPGDTNAQQRPRRGYDPVLTMIKLAISAASLQQRVINKLLARQTRRAA